MEDLAALVKRSAQARRLRGPGQSRLQPLPARPPARPARPAHRQQIVDILQANGVQVLAINATPSPVATPACSSSARRLLVRQLQPPAAFATVDPQLPCIALCHNPDAIETCAPALPLGAQRPHSRRPGTHPAARGSAASVRNRQYDAGLFHLGQQRLYVNRGLGYLRRIRFNCRPEITEFTLHPLA